MERCLIAAHTDIMDTEIKPLFQKSTRCFNNDQRFKRSQCVAVY